MAVSKAVHSTVKDSTNTTARDDWGTPKALFAALNEEFGFTLDAAASAENALCDEFITAEQDALVTPWKTSGAVYLNCPYSLAAQFVERAIDQCREQAVTIVMLVGARPDTQWFDRARRNAAEIRFVFGRLTFVGAKWQAPFPSAVIVFQPSWLGANEAKISWIDRNGVPLT